MPDKPCLAPLASVALTAQGEFRPCCWYEPEGKYNINNMTIDEYREQILFPMYENMKQGVYPDSCSRCLVPGRTRISYYEDLYEEERQIIEDTKSLRTMDVRLGNLCNISCITCSSYNSNYFYKIEEKGKYLFPYQIDHQWKSHKSWESNPDNINQILKNLHNIDRLYFTGGEPTINPGMRDILKYCIEHNLHKHITLELNTNCTNANKEFMDLMKHFKTRWFLSIDAYGELNDIIRYPAKFNALMNNIKIFFNNAKPGDQFVFVPTISIFNFFKLDEYIEQINKFIYKNATSDMDVRIAHVLNLLTDPNWQHLQNIPEELYYSQLEKIKDPWCQNLKNKIYSNNKQFAPSSTHSWEYILEITRNYFESRGFDPKITGIPGI